MRITNLFTGGRTCAPLSGGQETYAGKYRSFRSLLEHNHRALSVMSDMEHAYYMGKPFTLAWASARQNELAEAVFGLVHNLQALSGGAYAGLVDRCSAIDRELTEAFQVVHGHRTGQITVPLGDITESMKGMLGAKATTLAVIRNTLGLPVPDGFAVTGYAFDHFMEENGLRTLAEQSLACLHQDCPEELERVSARIRTMILDAKVLTRIEEEILKAYADLEQRVGEGVRVSIRSSAVGEDGDASFAGQFTSVLNVTKRDIVEAYKTVIASKYSPRAISYRLQYGLDDREIPMCVLAVAMIDARASGVAYTIDPDDPVSGLMRVNALWGLGEQLVGGAGVPDSFLVDKGYARITSREIAVKDRRVRALPGGGIHTEEVPEGERLGPSTDDETVATLARYCIRLEEHFGSPQDSEWALDEHGKLFILQSRPLHLQERKAEEVAAAEIAPGNPVLLAGGKTASSGVAVGRAVVVTEGKGLSGLPQDAIIVARTASPDFASVIGSVRGIITDMGSVTSHLASVAREFGVPMVVGLGQATASVPEEEVVTLSATTGTLYRGVVEPLLKQARPAKNHFVDSPTHRRMRAALDKISPLNLVDPESPLFSPEGCRTFHDVIRFCHERSMSAMSDTAGTASEGGSIRLETTLPLDLRLVDLGGGLRQGLTTCDKATADDIVSEPMKAVWRGFTHPGISWAGTVSFDMKKLVTLFAVTATSEFGELPGGTSFALLSKDYVNLNAKFGYHFATIDALCTGNSDQNYVSLQFSGGAGTYFGKSLRIQFLGSVLGRLGFQTDIKGDLIEAVLKGHDADSLREKLDQMGRLLASSRLLDMALSSQSDVAALAESFFRGDYDFLAIRKGDQPEHFYAHGGHWEHAREGRIGLLMQDGSKEGFTISSGLAGLMGRFVGPSLQDFLDNMGAYYYFPLAVIKDSEVGDGTVMARVKSTAGNIDRAAGLAFGIKNVGNYFVFRINALEDNAILFEFRNGKRIQRKSVSTTIKTAKWYMLKVEVKGTLIKAYLNNELVMEYSADETVRGHVGLWTKADSVSYFDTVVIDSGGQKRTIEH